MMCPYIYHLTGSVAWIGEKFASLFQDNELPQSHFGDKQKCKFFP